MISKSYLNYTTKIGQHKPVQNDLGQFGNFFDFFN